MRLATVKPLLGSMVQPEAIPAQSHVRANHVHVVVDADRSPEHVMSTFKAYASPALDRMALDDPDRRRWARHGSTRHLWMSKAVSAAVHYVLCEQGEPMAVFEMPAAR